MNPYKTNNRFSAVPNSSFFTQWVPSSVGSRVTQSVLMAAFIVAGFISGAHLLMLKTDLESAIYTPVTMVHGGTWEVGVHELVHSGLLLPASMLLPIVTGLFRLHRCWIVCLAGVPVGYFLYQSWNYKENGYGAIGL